MDSENSTNSKKGNVSPQLDIEVSCTEPSAKQQKTTEFHDGMLTMNVDQILEHVVKPCGVWQWSVVLLLACGSCSLVTFPVYANSASQHRCAMEPQIEAYFNNRTNLTFSRIGQLIGPWLHQNHSFKSSQIGCYRYQRDWDNLTWHELDILFQTPEPDTVLPNDQVESCPFGYVFESSPKHYPQNVVREFETVCHRSWLVPLGTSIYMCGMSLGFVIGGWCGGKFGRRRTILVCALLEILVTVWTSLSSNYISYVISRGSGALFSTAKNSVAGILVIELTMARYRSTFKTIQALGLAFFHRALLALWAYYVPYWRWLNFVAMGPSILGILYIFTLPESPRWLLSQNRPSEAFQVLKRGYMINHIGKPKGDFNQLIEQMKVIVPPETTNTTKPDVSTSERRTRKTSKLVLIQTTMLSVSIMFGVTLSFTGLIFYARIVRNYVYLVGFLNALMAVPGTVLFMLLYRYFARRKYPMLCLCAVGSVILAISALYTLVAQPENDTVLTIGSNLAFVLVLATLCMGNMYVPELFPSVWRSQAHGTVMGLARIGGIMCTFVNELDRVLMHGVPMLFYSIVLAFVSIGLLFLPDTKGENLPDR